MGSHAYRQARMPAQKLDELPHVCEPRRERGHLRVVIELQGHQKIALSSNWQWRDSPSHQWFAGPARIGIDTLQVNLAGATLRIPTQFDNRHAGLHPP